MINRPNLRCATPTGRPLVVVGRDRWTQFSGSYWAEPTAEGWVLGCGDMPEWKAVLTDRLSIGEVAIILDGLASYG